MGTLARLESLVHDFRYALRALAARPGFALAAMASGGVYGLVAYSAGLRRREIGIRMALGATRTQTLGLMMREGVRVVASGLAVGLLAARWLTGALTGLLHDIAPTHLPTLASVAAILAAAGLAATFVPVWRVTGRSTLEALQDD